MFLAIRYPDACAIKMQGRVISFIVFIREAHFDRLLVGIRIEGHLPLERPFTYFREVRVELGVCIAFVIHF